MKADPNEVIVVYATNDVYEAVRKEEAARGERFRRGSAWCG